jgi:hypothetical protein
MKVLVYMMGATALMMGSGAAVLAQPALTDDLRVCLAITQDTARLACYDEKVGRLDASAAKVANDRKEAAAKQAREAAAKAEADRKAAEALAAKQKVDAFGAEGIPVAKRDENAAAGKDDSVDELEAVITDVFYSSSQDLVVSLENGQMWRQTDGMSLPPVRSGDKVLIKKRMLSGYRMTLVRQRRTIDIKRYR